MGPTTVSYDTAKVWFQKFRNENLCSANKLRSERPDAVNEVRLLELVLEDHQRCTSELAEDAECSHTTRAQHLRGLGKTCRHGARMPYEHSGHQLQVRKDACMNFLTLLQNFWIYPGPGGGT
ncbi:unnamed protein product [Heligmosomoides polygyrus]|uniref:HTH_48 domain-containing protein n=1 Tax=Heligmosomoides polygyrus TaxID=6339 RepID=A0A183G5Y6_HELPZ|nr:unnamed protein product [Heligmosomoides polygyrus]